MTLTVGTNTYVLLADANTYFASSLSNDAWSAIDSSVQEQALVTAARMLDRQTWAGTKTSDAQAMAWPRSGVTDRYGVALSSSVVPQAIIDAQCELALAIQQDSTVQSNKNNSANIKSVKAGPVEVQFFNPVKGGRFPTVVQELVGQFMGGAAVSGAGFASGTCERSRIDADNPLNGYGLNGGV